ncbi:MAG: CoA transferase [Chloroflexota bacterium]
MGSRDASSAAGEAAEPVLSPYRVLDLAGEKGMFCGRVLADLGANVIKIERPGGDPARSIGPFYHNIADPEKSLFWFFHNAGKRGITLNLESEEGRGLFRRLVAKADFVVESFPPGYLGSLDLGYEELQTINRGVIMASITPFGQTGPYRDYKADDLVAMAMGGYMYQIGDEDRPPLRIMVPQSYVHAGAHAANSALIALYSRHDSGRGQHIDVSLVEAVMREMLQEWGYWEVGHHLIGRLGPDVARASIRTREAWPCKDGQVGYRIVLGAFARSVREIAKLMKEEGLPLGPFERIQNWDNLDYGKMDQPTMDEWMDAIGSYFQRYTKAELFQKAVDRAFYMAPSYNVKEIAEFEQLKARDFWAQIEHDELGDTIAYPSRLIRSAEIPWQIARRAPLIGEHNREVYVGELGLSEKDLGRLRQQGAI